ncbi:MmyB family transcriptional regulator [Kitasatospora sp. CB01950]
MYDDPTTRSNTVSPAARRFYADRERVVRDAVGVLRVAAGKDPDDRSRPG